MRFGIGSNDTRFDIKKVRAATRVYRREACLGLPFSQTA